MNELKDKFNRAWIIENSLQEISNYEKGVLTLRALHYRLVSRGMINTIQHYKRVIGAMTQARWGGLVDFDTFSDHDREMIGFTYYRETDLDWTIQHGKDQVKAWMNHYSKNRWENQDYYPEVMIEKKALQGVFETPCRQMNVTIGACKGYPSLTFLNEASIRIKEALDEEQKSPIILYFGDYDLSGEDIPRSISDNLFRMECDIEVRRIALMEDQVIEWELPPAPVKSTDSRTAKWDGLGQVELDAVEPRKLQELCADAIAELFDEVKYDDLMKEELAETVKYKNALKKYVKSL